MKKIILIIILGIFLISCQEKRGIIFSKQGYYIDKNKDTVYKFKVKDFITGDYVTIYKYSDFKIGDQISNECH